MTNPGLFLFIFVVFTLQLKLMKAKRVLGAAGWYAQTDPLSYAGSPRNCTYLPD